MSRASFAGVRLLPRALITLALAQCAFSASAEGAAARKGVVDSIRSTLEPALAAGASDGSSLQIDLDALYAPLDPEQRAFLESVRELATAPDPPTPGDDVEWVRLEAQKVGGANGEISLPVQLLPAPVWQAYDAMSRAMEKDLGKRLLVGSGYRSNAYQLFVFVSYLAAANYSIEETLRHVSLPSEHSQPKRQGIDFVSEEGLDLQYSDAKAFQALPEYHWLLENAGRFGFAPMPPPDAAVSPWHWHWEP